MRVPKASPGSVTPVTQGGGRLICRKRVTVPILHAVAAPGTRNSRPMEPLLMPYPPACVSQMRTAPPPTLRFPESPDCRAEASGTRCGGFQGRWASFWLGRCPEVGGGHLGRSYLQGGKTPLRAMPVRIWWRSHRKRTQPGWGALGVSAVHTVTLSAQDDDEMDPLWSCFTPGLAGAGLISVFWKIVCVCRRTPWRQAPVGSGAAPDGSLLGSGSQGCFPPLYLVKESPTWISCSGGFFLTGETHPQAQNCDILSFLSLLPGRLETGDSLWP